ncbi:MAG: hypothetical protein ACUZ8H_10270 [Candidatus Anammoxibacter sp.]
MKIVKSTAVVMLVLLSIVSIYAKDKTVEGELVDVTCNMGGATGAKHQMCAIACARNGQPIGIAAKDGKIYTLATMSPKLSEYMQKTIKVTGKYDQASQSIKPSQLFVKEGRKWVEIDIPKLMM